MVASGDDGSFAIAVPPGKGHLLVFGPTSQYILEEIGDQALYGQGTGGQRNYSHDILSYDVKSGSEPQEVTASLRPGKTIKGRVVGPAGETVDDAAIITALHIEHFNPSCAATSSSIARRGGSRFTV